MRRSRSNVVKYLKRFSSEPRLLQHMFSLNFSRVFLCFAPGHIFLIIADEGCRKRASRVEENRKVLVDLLETYCPRGDTTIGLIGWHAQYLITYRGLRSLSDKASNSVDTTVLVDSSSHRFYWARRRKHDRLFVRIVGSLDPRKGIVVRHSERAELSFNQRLKTLCNRPA